MIARRFAVFALSAVVGYGIALHERPTHRPALAAATVVVHPGR